MEQIRVEIDRKDQYVFSQYNRLTEIQDQSMQTIDQIFETLNEDRKKFEQILLDQDEKIGKNEHLMKDFRDQADTEIKSSIKNIFDKQRLDNNRMQKIEKELQFFGNLKKN